MLYYCCCQCVPAIIAIQFQILIVVVVVVVTRHGCCAAAAAVAITVTDIIIGIYHNRDIVTPTSTCGGWESHGGDQITTVGSPSVMSGVDTPQKSTEVYNGVRDRFIR